MFQDAATAVLRMIIHPHDTCSVGVRGVTLSHPHSKIQSPYHYSHNTTYHTTTPSTPPLPQHHLSHHYPLDTITLTTPPTKPLPPHHNPHNTNPSHHPLNH